jgi:hypothetical protein
MRNRAEHTQVLDGMFLAISVREKKLMPSVRETRTRKSSTKKIEKYGRADTGEI